MRLARAAPTQPVLKNVGPFSAIRTKDNWV
jgi:hypothetical protein